MVAARSSAEATEPADAALAWLDAQLAEDMMIDESAIDLLAIADDESARPICDDEMTPPRPSKIPGELPPSQGASRRPSAPPPSR